MATQIDDVMERLQAGVDGLTGSEAWTRWLRTARRFHHYSFGNQLLIALQCPDATRVAGYRAWQQLGRQVRKGERGIVILAPVTSRVRPEATDDEPDPAAIHVVRAFRSAHVFDLGQTDGEPLPEIATRLLGDDPVDAVSKLVACAGALDFTVSADRLGPDLNGFCDHANRRIVLNEDLEPRMGVKTLCHELAHALLHGPDRREGLARDLCELEAESVAFAVTAELGIDSGAYSFGYIAGWVGGGEAARKAITASGQRIVQAARAILDALEPMAELPTEAVA